MNMMNSLITEGKITKDIEVKELLNGTKVVRFKIAVSRYFKLADGSTRDEISYFDVECYGNTADIAEKHIVEGRGVRVVGRLKQERWSDETGKVHSRVFIVGEHIEFMPMPESKEVEE